MSTLRASSIATASDRTNGIVVGRCGELRDERASVICADERLRAGAPHRRTGVEHPVDLRAERFPGVQPVGGVEDLLECPIDLTGHVHVGAGLEVVGTDPVGAGLEQVGEGRQRGGVDGAGVAAVQAAEDHSASPGIRCAVIEAAVQVVSARRSLPAARQR
jgi:hypothetical protein